MVLALLLTMGFVAATPTIVNGHVYQQGTSTGVPDVLVTVTCDSLVPATDMTNSAGYYVVEFLEDCDLGDSVTVCAGDGNCEDGTIIGIPDWKNISYVNLEIPEFGLIAASVALAGAVAGFIFLRKKK